MSLIRTDYQTPYSQLGESVGQAIMGIPQGLSAANTLRGQEQDRVLKQQQIDAEIARIEKAGDDAVKFNEIKRDAIKQWSGLLDTMPAKEKDMIMKELMRAETKEELGIMTLNLDSALKMNKNNKQKYGGNLPGFQVVAAGLKDPKYAEKHESILNETGKIFRDKSKNELLGTILTEAASNPNIQTSEQARQYVANLGKADAKSGMQQGQGAPQLFGEDVSAEIINDPSFDKLWISAKEKANAETERMKARAAGGGSGGKPDDPQKPFVDAKKQAESNLIKIFSDVDAGIMDETTRAGLKKRFESQLEFNDMASDVLTYAKSTGIIDIDSEKAKVITRTILADKMASKPTTKEPAATIRAAIETAEKGSQQVQTSPPGLRGDEGLPPPALPTPVTPAPATPAASPAAPQTGTGQFERGMGELNAMQNQATGKQNELDNILWPVGAYNAD